ncbi:MAG TPA: GNAT family N-acetyltransferase [Sphingobacteriaceae bacterium]|nr:GNAT family N-acetyltransferase [Sphingobacteriaceae bacterium]
MENFIISTDKSRLQLAVIHDFLSNQSYWAGGIPLETVTRSIDNSICFGVYNGNDQIGFARVVSDKATFAYLADVFILKEFQGRGLSKKLVETILNHTELQGLRRWMLGTLDAHGLYNKYGFKALSQPDRFMELKSLKNYC